MMIKSILVLGAAAMILSVRALAPLQGTTSNDVEQRALELLADDLGTWECEWQRLNRKGEVFQTYTGTETFRYQFEPHVLSLRTIVPSKGQESESLTFFDPNEQKIRILSVDKNGVFWDMEKDLDTCTVTSKPQKDRRGRSMSIRFSLLEKTEDSRRILMEFTRDAGETWIKGFYQTMTRADVRGPSDDNEE